MLNFCSLYSGSTGNCLLVSTEDTNILIDVGVSQKKVIEALDSVNKKIEHIDAILVTHEHIDHVLSIGGLSQKYNIPVYSNIETFEAMPKQAERISKDNQNFFKTNKDFKIASLKIHPFSIPHDAANPVGFNIYKDKRKISIATDIGHIEDSLLAELSDSSFIMLEANYDPEILRIGHYPLKLKQRISGPLGHLSNDFAGKTVSALVSTGLNNVLLGHLSKENNFPELAHKTVSEEINLHGLSEKDVHIDVALRNKPSQIIKVS